VGDGYGKTDGRKTIEATRPMAATIVTATTRMRMIRPVVTDDRLGATYDAGTGVTCGGVWEGYGE